MQQTTHRQRNGGAAPATVVARSVPSGAPLTAAQLDAWTPTEYRGVYETDGGFVAALGLTPEVDEQLAQRANGRLAELAKQAVLVAHQRDDAARRSPAGTVRQQPKQCWSTPVHHGGPVVQFPHGCVFTGSYLGETVVALVDDGKLLAGGQEVDSLSAAFVAAARPTTRARRNGWDFWDVSNPTNRGVTGSVAGVREHVLAMEAER